MKDTTRKLGAAGEKAAVRYLKRNGYKVLARNYVCPLGELDVICLGDDGIVFVEVKTRTHELDADPEENIDARKRRKLMQVARYWLREHREPQCAYRFDALSVIIPDRGDPTVRHVQEAFEPTGY